MDLMELGFYQNQTAMWSRTEERQSKNTKDICMALALYIPWDLGVVDAKLIAQSMPVLYYLLLLYIFFSVFLSAKDANKVITRAKRARFFFFEEFLQGNLERECLEERCSLEEAREVFEDDKKLVGIFFIACFLKIRALTVCYLIDRKQFTLPLCLQYTT